MKKALTFFLLLSILSSCKKEEVINQIIVPNYNNDGQYILPPMPEALGNVKITIWPALTSDEAKIVVENRLDKPIGYIIRELNDVSFVYFSDSYIKGKGNSEAYGTKVPLDRVLYIKMIVYKSTLSYGLIVTIETLGLDFWTSIADYRDNLQQEYEAELILSP